MIKQVYKKDNLFAYNTHHNRTYFNKRGILVIEYDDRKDTILDLNSQRDMSECDYIIIKDSQWTKKTMIYKDILLSVSEDGVLDYNDTLLGDEYDEEDEVEEDLCNNYTLKA